ncbi:hypothetical protein [Sorangium sp. So ce1335]|uniref:hypothetical protein n=1 Tax=Sorangium sp. So ce1335 TaxID=3133335 RepID=UPI003F63C958
MAGPEPAKPFRGAIRTTVSTSTDALVAGQDFSIFVTVQNPFEAPLALRRVSTALPTELVDVDGQWTEQRIRQIEERFAGLEDPAHAFAPGGAPLGARLRRAARRLLRRRSPGRAAAPGAPAIARDLRRTGGEAALAAMELPVGSGAGFCGPAQAARGWHDEAEPVASIAAPPGPFGDDATAFRRALRSLEAPDPPAVLQSGNSTARAFTVRSRRALWFRAASYRLLIEVEYEVDGASNLDTIEHVLKVSASLGSMIGGAVVGGVGGWFAARGSDARLDAEAGVSLAASLVLVAMAVVLLARKRDVQPILAIEDFWGGVAVGFLIAYAGPSLFAGLFGLPARPPPASGALILATLPPGSCGIGRAAAQALHRAPRR